MTTVALGRGHCVLMSGFTIPLLAKDPVSKITAKVDMNHQKNKRIPAF